MLKFIFLFIAAPLMASELGCPSESLPIKYTSPVTKNKKVTCGYMKDGKLIKHGFENEYNSDGSLLKSDYYVEGAVADKPTAKTEKFVVKPTKQVELETIETKGASEPASPFGNFSFPTSED